jgi:hypothetical protein
MEFGSDGSNAQYLPNGLALLGSSLFWVDSGTDAIYRANIDGTAAEVIVTGIGDEVEFVAVIPEPSVSLLSITAIILVSPITVGASGRRLPAT